MNGDKSETYLMVMKRLEARQVNRLVDRLQQRQEVLGVLGRWCDCVVKTTVSREFALHLGSVICFKRCGLFISIQQVMKGRLHPFSEDYDV